MTNSKDADRMQESTWRKKNTLTILFKVVHYILNRSEKTPRLPLPQSPSASQEILGSLSNDDGDVNENGKNEKVLDWQNNNFALTSRFCTSFSRHCTTTTRKCLIISRFSEDLDRRQRLSFSFPEI